MEESAFAAGMGGGGFGFAFVAPVPAPRRPDALGRRRATGGVAAVAALRVDSRLMTGVWVPVVGIETGALLGDNVASCSTKESPLTVTRVLLEAVDAVAFELKNLAPGFDASKRKSKVEVVVV